MSNFSDKVKDLTLMLLYLTSWEEREAGPDYRRSWKGYDFDILNDLSEEGLIFGSHRSKSVHLGEEGIAKARALLQSYGLESDSPLEIRENDNSVQASAKGSLSKYADPAKVPFEKGAWISAVEDKREDE